MRRFEAKRAELMMRIGAFTAQNHDSRFKQGLAKLFLWANRKRYAEDALDFLESDPSIDNFDYSEIDEAASNPPDDAEGPDRSAQITGATSRIKSENSDVTGAT